MKIQIHIEFWPIVYEQTDGKIKKVNLERSKLFKVHTLYYTMRNNLPKTFSVLKF